MLLPSLASPLFALLQSCSPCAAQCDALAGTDRSTCLLQCEQRERPSDSGMTTWRRQERLGGAPPGSAHVDEAGSTTVVQTVGADGERTTTTTTRDRSGAHTVTQRGEPPPSKTASAPPSASAAPRRDGVAPDAWPALARCQASCDPRAQASDRATCKLTCLQLSTHFRGSRTAAHLARTHAATPSTSVGATATTAATTTAAATTVAAEAPGCHDACSDRAARCEAGCDGSAGERATCGLQCREAHGACARRCPAPD